jgi:phosphate transport system permease protein
MDWSIFNGIRTLAANIAVEIPESPYGGTLYRTLFLTASLLFLMTFAVNTVAEVIRQRLRERYKAV